MDKIFQIIESSGQKMIVIYSRYPLDASSSSNEECRVWHLNSSDKRIRTERLPVNYRVLEKNFGDEILEYEHKQGSMKECDWNETQHVKERKRRIADGTYRKINDPSNSIYPNPGSPVRTIDTQEQLMHMYRNSYRLSLDAASYYADRMCRFTDREYWEFDDTNSEKVITITDLSISQSGTTTRAFRIEECRKYNDWIVLE